MRYKANPPRQKHRQTLRLQILPLPTQAYPILVPGHPHLQSLQIPWQIWPRNKIRTQRQQHLRLPHLHRHRFILPDLRGAGAPRTAEAIRAGLDKEFDKFTIWPDEERGERVA